MCERRFENPQDLTQGITKHTFKKFEVRVGKIPSGDEEGKFKFWFRKSAGFVPARLCFDSTR